MCGSEEVASPSKKSQKRRKKSSKVLECGFMGCRERCAFKIKCTPVSEAAEIPNKDRRVSTELGTWSPKVTLGTTVSLKWLG